MPQPDPASFADIKDAREDCEAAQWWLLFAIMVAGKKSEPTAEKLRQVLACAGSAIRTPFGKIEHLDSRSHTIPGSLGQVLRWEKVGQYNRIEAAFRAVTCELPLTLGPDPRTWTVSDLEAVKGIGPKTARWFFMLCHPEARVAALDTHVLKFLRDQGISAPKSTPAPGALYSELEAHFVEYANRLGVMPRDLDFMAWAVYRNGGRILLEGNNP